jgi:DNA ligase 1
MTPESIINEIASNNSKLHKEAVLVREAQNDNDTLFAGLKMCYDPMITFGVKQVPEKTNLGTGNDLTFEEFNDLASQLEHRELTGQAAKDAIDAVMNKANLVQWNGWYRLILIKDMRAGFSETTVNKAVKKANKPNYSIPVFECQLAHDGANHESKIDGNKMIEVKLDGVRVITVVYPDGRVDQFSRNGKELANFPAIREQFAAMASALEEPMVFDGEIMSSSFQDLMKQVHRKSNVETTDAILYLFDWLSLEEFSVYQRSNIQQQTRSRTLQEFIEAANQPNIKALEFEWVSLESILGQKQFKEINARAIAGGYEGIMVKDPYAPYECKRTVNWLKIKPFIEVTLEVIDIEEGTGRNVGRLGALVCEGEDDGRIIRVNVGSGFSDSLRDAVYSDKTSVVGHKVEVRADAVTQNQDGSYSLRFPRFKTFRGFKIGEKI